MSERIGERIGERISSWATRRAVLVELGRAIGDFFRGFAGLPGTPGAPPSAQIHDAASARRALEERAAQRRSCC